MNRTWLVSKFKSTQSDWWFGICFIFPYIGNVIIPFDELIFFRGVGIPPTSHVKQGLNTKKWHWSRSTHADPNGVSCSKVRELRKMRCSSAPLKPVYTPIQCWAPTWSHLSSNPLLFFNQDAPEKSRLKMEKPGKFVPGDVPSSEHVPAIEFEELCSERFDKVLAEVGNVWLCQHRQCPQFRMFVLFARFKSC